MNHHFAAAPPQRERTGSQVMDKTSITSPPSPVLRMRAAIALLMASLLGACTPMQWERNGYALDTADRDWNDCRQQSIMGANRWMFYDPFPRSFIGRDARGRAFSYYRPAPFPNRFMLEQDYLDNCLRGRGYQRVPLKPVQTVAPAPAAVLARIE